ncbi:hypothetical protein V1514DRAFT_329489 [Lipomyces japonicus]|uniref:uncharacterized protein n=1 Tax=Lipomyces japonicus TaxID=56871 RepID=UPI0034CF2A5D
MLSSPCHDQSTSPALSSSSPPSSPLRPTMQQQRRYAKLNRHPFAAVHGSGNHDERDEHDGQGVIANGGSYGSSRDYNNNNNKGNDCDRLRQQRRRNHAEILRRKRDDMFLASRGGDDSMRRFIHMSEWNRSRKHMEAEADRLGYSLDEVLAAAEQDLCMLQHEQEQRLVRQVEEDEQLWMEEAARLYYEQAELETQREQDHEMAEFM